jgi:DNA-binding transcriptional regulator YiaG
MTATDFRGALDAMSLSQAACGRWLEVDERTVRRWAEGGPPRSVALLLALMVQYGLRPDDL